MAFTEYLGYRELKSTSGMDSLWDLNWSGQDLDKDVERLASFPHWPWIQEYLPAPARILEAGCGLAKWVRFLEVHGYEAHGIDFSKVAVEASLKMWPGLQLAHGDLRNLPYSDDYFDGIMSLGVVEHDIEGPHVAVREMRRVLRPGGILYCTVPCYNVIRRSGLWSVRRMANHRKWRRSKAEPVFFEYLYTPREYASIMMAAGFELVRLVPLERMNSPGFLMGRSGSRRSRLTEAVHRRWPWLLTHMMAAICRKC